MAFADLSGRRTLLPARRTSPTGPSSSSATCSASITRCGIRRCRTLSSASGCCGTTCAGTARRTRRPAITAWPILDGDALALLDALGLDRVIWCGQSIGGMVGQWLAHQRAGSVVASHPRQHHAARRRSAGDGSASKDRASRTAWPRSSDTAMRRFFTPALARAEPAAHGVRARRRFSRRARWDTPAAVPPFAISITRHCWERSERRRS